MSELTVTCLAVLTVNQHNTMYDNKTFIIDVSVTSVISRVIFVIFVGGKPWVFSVKDYRLPPPPV
jgi:hypothetical protein